MLGLILLAFEGIFAQKPPSLFEPDNTNIWWGTYTKARLSEKLYWNIQHHFRTGNYDNVPFTGRVTQIYNRHAIDYRVRPNVMLTAGMVLRLDFTPEPGNRDDFAPVVLEPRFWEEIMFAMPFEKMIVYHRIRLEHRWSRRNDRGNDFIFRNRWRYKLFMKIPLNGTKLVPKTWFLMPDVEIMLQTGKPVGGSVLEDLRVYPQIGYIANTTTQYTMGMMYTTGQRLSDATVFRSRWIFRANVYLTLDFRKLENKVPETRIFD